MEEIFKRNFRRWNEALQTKRPEEVTKLYSRNTTFLPTFSDEFRKGKEKTKDYFENFLKKNPRGKIVEEEVQMISSEAYSHSGMYNFEATNSEGKKQEIEARFTFIWKKNGEGEWKIIHHHSSPKISKK